MIYLDHAATSPLLPEVRARLHELLDVDFGNASALHTPGQRAKHIIETARTSVAQLINAAPEEIIFTSGGSESNNTVINTFAGKRIAVSQIEHPSVLEAAKARAGELELIKVDQFGRVNPDDLPAEADLVSVMLANNELGTIEPIREITERCHARGIPVHTDATQALGKIPVDAKALGVDYLTASGHKIGAPLGVGIIYCKKGCKLTPLIFGGHQENKLRAGTSNVLAIAGLDVAARYTIDHDTPKIYAERVRPLRDQLRQRILAEIPYSSSNSPLEGCLPNILNVSFQAAEGESIQLYFDAAEIVVSTGSACAAGDIAPSHVLMATRHDAEVAHSSIRFSLGFDTTEQDIDEVMRALPSIIERLQGISTIKPGEK